MNNLRTQVTTFAFFTYLLLIAFSAVGFADEITDQMDSARTAYESGNYNQALQELNFSIAQIQTKMENQFATGILPDPLPGWELSGDSEGPSRNYIQGDASISVEILTQPFLIQAEVMMMSNPMILSSSNSQMVQIHGTNARKAVEGDGGEIAIVIDNQAVVKIEGYGLTSTDVLMQYANAVNYEKLRSILKPS